MTTAFQDDEVFFFVMLLSHLIKDKLQWTVTTFL